MPPAGEAGKLRLGKQGGPCLSSPPHCWPLCGPLRSPTQNQVPRGPSPCRHSLLPQLCAPSTGAGEPPGTQGSRAMSWRDRGLENPERRSLLLAWQSSASRVSAGTGAGALGAVAAEGATGRWAVRLARSVWQPELQPRLCHDTWEPHPAALLSFSSPPPSLLDSAPFWNTDTMNKHRRRACPHKSHTNTHTHTY